MKDGSQTDHVAERNLILTLDLESLTYDLDFSFPGELQSDTGQTERWTDTTEFNYLPR